ncbi:nitroreductase family protein [Mycobacterium sp. CVI_P3]|uniref:Nitroreductase family protein n=1 Tax=Mycobacterium pinniadriaticum TaxID=2994102 RepID=A0ABT3SJ23_9MYCO|nr:nitroreductase family protein [Mycobacterium pinniadriaticum]MCX2933170.1 nitroreductase family protein [Mycobacterium pinniadriaticum]MCX2939530.1 nitroreductase family protein [Mycobacterium pinniadriaticum]
MADLPADRHAPTRVPIHPPIAARWSPRAFDPDAMVTAEQLIGLLEAARWAATWGHRQPVRFVVGRHGTEAFTTLAGLLRRGNSYAHAAGALILVCADEGEDDRTALYSAVDAGAAIANLSVEAVARGLIVHPMAGFDVDGARNAFHLPDGVRPLAVVAVGFQADYARVGPEIAERDGRPRERLPLDQIVLNWSGTGLAEFAQLGDDPVVEQ